MDSARAERTLRHKVALACLAGNGEFPCFGLQFWFLICQLSCLIRDGHPPPTSHWGSPQPSPSPALATGTCEAPKSLGQRSGKVSASACAFGHRRGLTAPTPTPGGAPQRQDVGRGGRAEKTRAGRRSAPPDQDQSSRPHLRGTGAEIYMPKPDSQGKRTSCLCPAAAKRQAGARHARRDGRGCNPRVPSWRAPRLPGNSLPAPGGHRADPPPASLSPAQQRPPVPGSPFLFRLSLPLGWARPPLCRLFETPRPTNPGSLCTKAPSSDWQEVGRGGSGGCSP